MVEGTHKAKKAMKPACFSNPGSPLPHNSSPSKENLITCIYQAQIFDSPVLLTLSWSKTPFSHTLTVYSSDAFSFTVSLLPSTFFFRARPGSKSIHLNQTQNNSQKIKLHWDFTRTQFTHNSAEPESRFYVALTCNGKVEFFLGDLRDELARRTGSTRIPNWADPTLLSKREHVFGRRNYITRADFMGSKHDIEIECSGGTLKVKFNGETRLTVKRLAWKFRGNERIILDGMMEVEFYWDVFNWVNNNGGIGSKNGHGVFVFQVGDGGVWPEMVGPEKRLMRKNVGAAGAAAVVTGSPAPSWSTVMQWAEESSEGGRSSSSESTRSSGGSNGGFSLVVYAWRRE